MAELSVDFKNALYVAKIRCNIFSILYIRFRPTYELFNFET